MAVITEEALRQVLPQGERPTLKTISQLSGFAVPTVSRALNDAPDIGAKTKLRVREIAEQIGYQPNRTGLRLRTGKTNVIALVLATDHDMMNTTARLISSVAATTRGTTYHMNVTPYFPNEDPMVPVRYLVETRSADGLILNQTQPDDPRVSYLMERGVPFATHGRTNWCADHPYFDFDNGAFGASAVKKLVARGRKHILLIPPNPHQFYARDFTNGARRMASELGVDVQISDGLVSDASNAEVEKRMTDIFASSKRIDGIISISSNAAMAATVSAENAGRVLGGDFDLVSKESLPFLTSFRKEMIVMFEDATKAGTFLCEAVMRAIDQPDLPPMQMLDVPSAD